MSNTTAKKIPDGVKIALYWFVEHLLKGMLEDDRWDFDESWFEEGVKDWGKYQSALLDSGVMKTAFTVWSNNVELDENGIVTNDGYAEFRAFQSIRPHFDDEYTYDDIEPPFEQWEVIENEF